ncbi:MAG TPA: DsbA family protein [Nitrospirota bacterium]|nr:DsbA family protein [Nitrospirota bacterium]
MGEGIVDKLKQEFDLAVEWRGLEIHPETPPEGTPMAKRFRPADTKRMMEHLRTMGAAFGITFAERQLLSNSRLALQAVEFARDNAKFQEYHQALFTAYFSEGLNIGDLNVLGQIARDTGLDADAMIRDVENGKYLSKLAAVRDDAARLGVTGVPTFFIGMKKSIVGAQPLEVFRKALSSR